MGTMKSDEYVVVNETGQYLAAGSRWNSRWTADIDEAAPFTFSEAQAAIKLVGQGHAEVYRPAAANRP